MTLFDKPGKENTKATLDICLAAARERSINQIVIATSTGEVAKAFLPYVKEFHIVCVGQVYYFRADLENAMSEETRKEILDGGMTLYHGSHVLSGAERALSGTMQGVYPVEIIAHTLRLFGQGTKVAVECAVMALDAGLIKPGPTISVGGTGRGADTAIILSPASASRILDTQIHEFLCKPSFYS